MIQQGNDGDNNNDNHIDAPVPEQVFDECVTSCCAI